MFNYIITLIVMVVVLSLGFYFVGKIPQKMGEAQFERFKNQIINDIELESRNDDGINHNYLIGDSFDRICFRNEDGTILDGVDPRILAEYDTSSNSFMTRSNIFLIGKNEFKALEADARIKVPDQNTIVGCFNITRGRVYLFFEGHNRYLEISPQEES
ncbi:hypothetical protein DRJ17_00005 [Candidatus Woesearchaeota archaeon]|nr:MAG: hypothetical protein DRJ17_00005 [Candidatus Woesearchaeota archaeon]